MTLLIGILYGFLLALDPGNHIFYLIKYGSLFAMDYAIIFLYSPLILKRVSPLLRVSTLIVLTLYLGIFTTSLVFYLYDRQIYSLSEVIRIGLHIPVFIFMIWKKRDLSKYLIRSSFVFNAVGIFQYVIMGQQGRIQSLFSHPNFYSLYLIVVIIFIMEKVNFEGRKKFLSYSYIIFILLLLLFGTGARTSFAVAMVILAYNFFIFSKRRLLNIFGLVSLAILSLPLYKYFSSYLMTTRIFNMSYGYTMPGQIDSYQWRLMRWSDGLSSFRDYPLINQIFGYGWQTSPILSRAFNGMAMHNEYLRMLVDFGVIGAAVYVIALLSLFFYAVKKQRQKGYYSLSLIVLLIMIYSYSENIFVAGESFAILLLSVANSLSIINRKYLTRVENNNDNKAVKAA
ncbi:O-antigen ligase family protein [Neobacillus cucumis]|uniref:O-antigen ligase family protein n=1 Tax=Neobacillus cucumis TaxID=1740721 RepID=UPI002040C17B|nr:O-antigen ligase family protein [Neobacillus cucumis]MCM3729110.1 O-antigen ligase family protein [Neobacillus cucumis]